MQPKELTWGDVFADFAKQAEPIDDRAALAAAHFATLREVLKVYRQPLTPAQLFDEAA